MSIITPGPNGFDPARVDTLTPTQQPPNMVACDRCGCVVIAALIHRHDPVCPGR